MPNQSKPAKSHKSDENQLNRSRKVLESPIGNAIDAMTEEEQGAEVANGEQEITANPVETGGPEGPEPTRYGDWEKKGRCIDF